MMQKNIPPSTFNRRRFLQIVAATGAAGICLRLGISPESAKYHVVRRSQALMGTTLNLIVCSPDRDQAEEAVNGTISRMLNLEQRLSRHSGNSEVTLLNRTGRLDQAGADLTQIIDLAQSISKKTDGSFDITVLPLLALHQDLNHSSPDPAAVDRALDLVGYQNIVLAGNQVSFTRPGMGITLDGIGKGYIVDQGVAALQKSGFNNIFVEAGGDLMVRGGKTNNQPWRIGIRNPRPAMVSKLKIIETENLAVATSGDYMQAYSPDFQHHHIINPLTGFSPPELASCTITAPTCVLADALATGAMVLGPTKAMNVLADFPGCEGYFIDKDLKPYQTSGFLG